jgi:hypothetical protein
MTLQDETITMPLNVGSRVPYGTVSLQKNWLLVAVFSTNSEIGIVNSTHSDLIKFFLHDTKNWSLIYTNTVFYGFYILRCHANLRKLYSKI